MKGKAVIPLVLGLGMGLVAIKMGLNMIDSARGSQVDTIPVVVAARTIDASSRIDKTMLKIVPVPKTLIPPGAFQDIAKVDTRVALMNIATGLPISQEMLAQIGAEPGLPSQIPDGYRAIAVRVDESTAVAGFVLPGHHVDIFSIESEKYNGRASQKPVSRMLLEDVVVAAVGQSIKSVDPDGKSTRLTRSVTLYVKPEDVSALDVASRGTIRLALRGNTAGKANADGMLKGLSGFFSGLASIKPVETPTVVVPAPVMVEVVPPPPPTHTIEIHRGQAVERVTFATADSMDRVSEPSRNGGSQRSPDSSRIQAPLH